MSRRHYICAAAELPEGGRKIIQVEGLSIGVFNVKGSYYALRNMCPHKLAPLCLGPLTGHAKADHPGVVEMDRVGEVLRCPWHGWEFDIKTGKSLFNPHRPRVKTYEVRMGEAVADPGVQVYSVEVQGQGIYVHL